MPAMPVAGQIQVVAGCGYGAIELVAGESPNALNPRTVTVSEVHDIRRRIDDAGLALPSIACHGDLLVDDPARRADEKARVVAAMDLAANLRGPEGAPCVVTMAWGTPDADDATRRRIVDAFIELGEAAAARGVVVAIEPHVGQALDLPDRAQAVLDAVGSPFVRLNFDNSHFEVMGCHAADYVPQLAPYAVHTHLKDQRGIAPDHEFLVPGEGDFDYVAYLARLASAGYTGSVTVEISKMVQGRDGYDPHEVAVRSFAVLEGAVRASGIVIEPARKEARG
jgi:inosose dehydratase